MAKQLNVDLRFNADTTGAKKAIADLQASLNNLMQFNQSPAFKITDEIAAANVEVNKLQVALQSAMNPKTGTLDLSRLQQSLQQAGSSISQVEVAFNNMGAAGQVAFQQFAATIAQAQVPTMRLNGLMGEMWTTLKNVARFQISSSIIHNLVGGIQSAFTYAQNLNESLNNIRIVTGDSSEKMAQFAREANTAAKNLSSTTLDYTNASLIYYQQGLNDQQVKERTDVTIKLANVSRQSAQEVSDQMTAIWNNFDQGSHSMEYFADVITALGATTASSSEEIATGLEKFAPIAGTIGLSYEKATAALATIVANTRQSAESVGTGLRTIFSRFESLSLGETLEDGVDLNKYTKALKTVGVNVLDANGKLKTMDTILDDIAKAWERLDNTQKTALATTVGGVRQYTNLMALFDNWDDMQRNIATATGAEGTLQNQADIYAESWEAARNRVQTALQGLFDTLINDDAFIGMLNGIESIISGIDSFIQNMGGAKTVVLGLSAAVLSFANAGVADSLKNMVYNIKSLTGIGQKEVEQTKQNLINRALSQQMTGSPLQQAQFQASQNQVALQQTLNTYGREYNSIQRELANLMIQGQAQYDNAVIKAQEEVDLAERKLRITQQTITARGRDQASNALLEEEIERTNELAEARTRLQNATDNASTNMEQTQKNLQDLKTVSMSGTDIFAGFTSGITSAIFSITMFTNAWKTLGDESASVGQKISTVVLTLSTSIPMLLRNFQLVKTSALSIIGNLGNQKANVDFFSGGGISKLASQTNIANMTFKGPQGDKMAAYAKETAALSARNAAQALGISQSQMETALDRAKVIGKGKITAATLEEALAEQGVNAQQQLGIIGSTQLALAKNLEAAGWSKATAAMVASLGVYIAIAAAIAAVVAVIYLMVQAYNADAIAAKKAAEAHKELQQKSKDAAQELQNIKDAFNGYNKAVDALNECTKGTEEWYDALKAVNNEVLSIMENNPELAKQMQTHRDANGMLVIDNKDQLINQAQTIADKARNVAIMGAVSASEAQLKSDKTDFTRRFSATYDETGAQISGVEGLSKILSNLSEFTPGDTKGFAKAIEELGIDISKVDIESFRDSVWELAKANTDLANITENAANAIVEAKLGSEYSGAAKEVVSEAYEIAYKTAYQEARNAGTKGINVWSGKNDPEVQAFWRQYSEATGTSFSLDNNAVVGTDSNRYFQYLDNGEKKKISLEEAAAAIAAAEALKSVADSAQQATIALQKIELPEGTKDDFENFIANGNFGMSSEEDFQALFGDLIFNDKIIQDNFNIKFKSKIEQFVADLGLEGEEAEKKVQEILESMYNAANSYNEGLRNVGSTISATAKSAFDEVKNTGVLKHLTASAQENIAQIFDQAFKTQGSVGVQYLTNMFNNAGENADDLADILNNINWQTTTAQELSDKLTQIGISVEATDPNLTRFIEKMQLIAGMQIEEAQKKYQSSVELREKYEKGEELSTEDLGKLIALVGNEELAKSMVTQNAATGGYIVIDPSKFLTATGNATAGYDVYIKSFEENLEKISNLQNSGYNLNNDNSYNSLTTASGAIGYGGQLSFDSDKLQAQLDLLTANGNYTFGVEVDPESVTLEYINQVTEACQKLAETLEYDLANGTRAVKDLTDKEIVSLLASATTVGELQDRAEKYNATAEQTQKGYIALAQSTEEGRKALQQYNKEIEDAGEDSEEAAKATKKFQKTIKDIQARQAAKNIRELNVDLNNLSDWDAEQIATQLQSVFGKGITKDFIQNNKDLVNQWLNGTEQQRQAAADAMETVTDMQGQLDNLDLSTEIYISANGDAVALTAEQIETYKRIIAANPPTVDVNGHADMSQIVQELINAGMTAQQVANLLASVSETQVDFDAGAFNMPPFPSEGGPDAVADWMSQFSQQMANQGMNVASFDVPSGGIPDMTSGGGGGGGGGKKKTKDIPKPDRSARYHEVTRKQNANQKRQEAAQDAADRTVGRTRIKQLERQIQLEQKSLDLMKEKLEQAQQYIKVDTEAMQNVLTEVGLVAELGANSMIDNYERIYNDLFEKEKQLVEDYNNGLINDEKFEEEKKKIDEAKEAMSDYEETFDTAQEAAEKLVDSINEMLDLQLQKITYDVEFQINLNNADIKLLEHLYDKIDNDSYSAAQSIHLLGQEQQILLDTAQKYQEEYSNIMQEMYAEADKWRNKAKEDTELQSLLLNYGLTYDDWKNLSDEQIINYLNGAGYTETLQELSDQLLDLDSQIDDISQKIVDKFIGAFDDLYDKSKEQIDVFDKLSNVLEHYSDIVDLTRGSIGASIADATMANIRDKKINNATAKVGSSYQLYQTLAKQRQEYERKIAEASTEEEKKRWTEIANHAIEKEREAQEAYLADATDALDQIKEKASDVITKLGEDFKNAFAQNLFDDDWFNTVYDRSKKLEDSFVQDYEKLYRMSELEIQSNKLLDDISNPKYRNMLLDFQERVNNYKKAGVKISQSQIDAEQKWLDLIQARIDLENAQNAKNLVRLQRDNEGNWGYVYTADTDAIDDANAKVQKALYEYQNSLYNSNQDILNEVRDFQNQLGDEMDSLNQRLLDGLITEEQYKAETERLKSLAENQLNIYRDQYKLFSSLFNETYDETLELYGVDDANINEDFSSALLGRLLGYNTIDEAIDNIVPGLEDLAAGTVDAWKTMGNEQDAVMAQMDTSLTDLTTDVTLWADAIAQASAENIKVIDEMNVAFSDTMTAALQAVEEEWGTWLNQIQETQTELLNLVNTINDWNRLIHYAGDTTGNNAIPLLSADEVLNSSLNPNILQPAINTSTYGDLSSIEYEDYIRQIIDYLNLQAQTASIGFGNLAAGDYNNMPNNTLEQNVHIEASFPNVSDRNELEEAFENLVNKAAQYAHQYKRDR